MCLQNVFFGSQIYRKLVDKSIIVPTYQFLSLENKDFIKNMNFL